MTMKQYALALCIGLVGLGLAGRDQAFAFPISGSAVEQAAARPGIHGGAVLRQPHSPRYSEVLPDFGYRPLPLPPLLVRVLGQGDSGEREEVKETRGLSHRNAALK
jgi:hypothetical protein